MEKIADMLYREYLRQKRAERRREGKDENWIDKSINFRKTLNDKQLELLDELEDCCYEHEEKEKIEIIDFLLEMLEQD